MFLTNIHEFSKITFSDKAIVDSDNINGHYAVYDKITIGPCKVGGISCGGNYVANALITNAESGPMRVFIGTYPSSGREKIDETSSTYQNISNGYDEPLLQEHYDEHV